MTSELSPTPAAPIKWPAEDIWLAVEPRLPGFTVEVLPQVDSSNSELMRRFRAGPHGSQAAPEPTLLVAEHQTAGRGRMGRSWHGQRGDSLTFSLGLALQPTDWSGLSLAVGISLAESLEPTPRNTTDTTRIKLKWPNDLWLSGQTSGEPERKLAGILVETTSWEGLRYVVIGVGINIRLPELSAFDASAAASSDAPAALAPGCLQALLPDIDAAAALLRVVPPLVQALQAFERFGFAPFQARFARRDALAGREVQLSDGTLGTAMGVAENGALLVHTATGMKEITSSEVSVRPVHGSTARRALEGLPPC